MILKVFLHLTAHHLVHLSCMLCLYKKSRELIDLEQSVSKSSIQSPESAVPKYLAVFFCPCFNRLVLWMRCITEIMVRKCHPFFMEFFTQRHRLASYEIGRITVECCLHRAQPFYMMVVATSVCVT